LIINRFLAAIFVVVIGLTIFFTYRMNVDGLFRYDSIPGIVTYIALALLYVPLVLMLSKGQSVLFGIETLLYASFILSAVFYHSQPALWPLSRTVILHADGTLSTSTSANLFTDRTICYPAVVEARTKWGKDSIVIWAFVRQDAPTLFKSYGIAPHVVEDSVRTWVQRTCNVLTPDSAYATRQLTRALQDQRLPALIFGEEQMKLCKNDL
jgi:hypothetical protein